MEYMQARMALPGNLNDRYFTLLLRQNPARLIELTHRKDISDAATNFLIAHASNSQAFAGITQRSQTEPSVWKPAYTALAGLYFKDASASVVSAFQTALGDGTIGQHLDHKITRDKTLAGDVWYYYGSRYGEYLGVTHKGDDEDFIPAELERTPADAAAYFNSARYYEDAAELDRAVADYQHVIELSPERIDAHNRLAAIYSQQKRADDALAEEKLIIKLLKAQAADKTPATFVGDYTATVAGLSARKQLAQLMPDFVEILHAYLKTNGSYRHLDLLRATYPAGEAQRDATALALDLSTVARTSFLEEVLAPNANIHVDQEQVFHALLASAQADVDSSEGAWHDSRVSQLRRIQLKWLQYLLRTNQFDRLREQLNALPNDTREALRDSLTPIEIKLAAQNSTLDELIASYRSDAEHAPSADLLRKTATELVQTGDKQAARKLLEFVFAREVENHNFTAPNMIGLADIRIQSGDLQGGLSLLRRMALVVGNPFETQDPSAAMLVRTGHPAEAIPFLEELVRAVPWNADYRVRLNQARIAANLNIDNAHKELAAVASSSNVPYETRVNAASALAGHSSSTLGSKELDLLAATQPITAADANQPFFFAARLKAAESLPAAARVSLLRSALEDNSNGDSARVPLLKAAFQTGDYYLAIATLKPQMQSNALEEAFTRRHQNDDDDGLESEMIDVEPGLPESQAGETQGTQSAALQGFDKLPSKEWAEISRDVGIALQKTGDLNQSLIYLRRAYRLEKDPAIKTQINRSVQQVRAAQRVNATNLARQPLVHTALEQEHVVKPRTGVPTSPKPVGTGMKGAI